MFRQVLIFSALASAAAHAQTFSLSLTLDATTTGQKYTFGTTGCAASPVVYWRAPAQASSAAFCTGLTLWLTSGVCGTAAAAGDYPLATVDTTALLATQGQFNVPVSNLPIFTSAQDGGLACGATGTLRTGRLCGHVEMQSSTVNGCASATKHDVSLDFVYDSAPPAIPVVTSVEPADTELLVGLSTDSDTSAVRISFQNVSDPAVKGEATFNVSPTTSSYRLSGLENETEYDLSVIAIDAVGNESQASAVARAAPVTTLGFMAGYRAAGGKETGGCAASPAPMLVAVSLLVLGLRRRKS